MNTLIPTPPPLEPGSSREPEPRRYQRWHLWLTATSTVLAALGVVVAIVAWRRPVPTVLQTPPPRPIDSPRTPVIPQTPAPPPEEPREAAPSRDSNSSRTVAPRSVPADITPSETSVAVVEPVPSPPPEPTVVVDARRPEAVPLPPPLGSSFSEPPVADTRVEDDPQVSVGDQIVVVGESLQKPKGARLLSQIRVPLVPSDALKSFLSGRVIVCYADIGPEGRAVGDCTGNPGAPGFVLRRMEENIAAASWQPATDDRGQPCKDRVRVDLSWR